MWRVHWNAILDPKIGWEEARHITNQDAKYFQEFDLVEKFQNKHSKKLEWT